MAYTNEQKAEYYLQKYKEVVYSPPLARIYWQLYKSYNDAGKALKQLEIFRKNNPIRKTPNYHNLKLKH